jgi:uncharacterized glyoxalase superfamily protein PhnB
MSTTFQNLRPMLWTDKIKETIIFYTETLGFTCGEFSEDWGWASLYRDGVEVMLAKPNEHEEFTRPKFTGSFYITVEDVDAVWNELKNKVQICYSIENFDYGMRDFGIYDNNGYLLQFGTEIKA